MLMQVVKNLSKQVLFLSAVPYLILLLFTINGTLYMTNAAVLSIVIMYCSGVYTSLITLRDHLSEDVAFSSFLVFSYCAAGLIDNAEITSIFTGVSILIFLQSIYRIGVLSGEKHISRQQKRPLEDLCIDV